MDSNETLRTLRNAAKIIDAHNNGSYVREDDLTSAVNDMAEGFLALDEWLTKGGFLPTSWINSDPREFERAAKEAVALANSHGDGTLPTD